MTTEEGNKLIAEFDGWVFNHDRFFKDLSYTDGDSAFHESCISRLDLPYHKSWELLMPVVEKIELLGYSSLIERLYTGEHRVYFCSDKTFASVGPGARDNEKICAVWIAVISFIEWLNKGANLERSVATEDAQ